MENKLNSTTAMIMLIAGSILGPPLVILLFGAIGFAQGGILALPLSALLMYSVLSKVQDRKKRKVFIISVYSYSGIWVLAGLYMVFIAFPMAQRSYCPLTGIGELLIGVLCFAMAAIPALGLTVSIVVVRSKRKAVEANI